MMRIPAVAWAFWIGVAAITGAGEEVIPHVTIRVEPARVTLDAGRSARVRIRMTVPAGHHAYLNAGEQGNLIPVSIDATALDRAGFRVGLVSQPEGEAESAVKARVLRGTGAYILEISATSRASVGETDAELTVTSQLCDDAWGRCYLPDKQIVSFRLNTLSVPSQDEPQALPEPGKAHPSPEPSRADVDYARFQFPEYAPELSGRGGSHGLWGWLALAFLAGLILNVMPCVLPVVSLKILGLMESAGQDRRRAAALGLAFSAGIVTVFMALAVAVVRLNISWGEQFQNSIFLVVMIAVVFALALSLLGVFEIGVPVGTGALAARVEGRDASTFKRALADAFFKGMVATLLATPCSGPFLGSTLFWTLAQPAGTVLLVFFVLGLGMAAPYALLAVFPAWLRFLPKPGPWLITFKQIMGFVLLATVIYLMISLDRAMLLFTGAFLVFMGAACWMWGRFGEASAAFRRRVSAALSAAVLAGGGAWVSFVALPMLFSEADWEPFDPQALVRHHAEGRSVFVDFTADWCVNCKTNEAFVYSSGEIRRLIKAKGVVAMKADLTGQGPRQDMIRRLMVSMGSRSVPFMAVFPGDRPLAPITRPDLVNREDVRSILEALPDPPK